MVRLQHVCGEMNEQFHKGQEGGLGILSQGTVTTHKAVQCSLKVDLVVDV